MSNLKPSSRTLIVLAVLAAMPGIAEAAASKAAQQFVATAGHAGTYEVQAGELAVQRATSPDVKSFAQQMVTDHTKIGEALKTAAGAMPLPAKLDVKHTKELAELKVAPAGSFDALYLKQQLDAHEKAVALLKVESSKGDDPALKSFAATNLPTLQHHLEMVQALEKTQSK
ncbi:MAG: DUF4142 domain-containing protein [Candidatus Kaistia colombiensis]|nr:MAG: DUF4142 domain-containing protein [Kaistia sp.]